MRSVAIGILSFFVMGHTSQPVVFSSQGMSSLPSPQKILYTVAKRYEPLAWMDGGERFSAGATVFLQDAADRHALVPEFAATADATVSFDGTRVMFSGKRTPADHWQIWEVLLEGGTPRRVTNCAEDCIRPFYLPEDRVVYAQRLGGRFVIQAAGLGGDNALPLTYGPGSSLPTDVLRDGRVLFDATFPLGEKGPPEIYTVYSDGSGIEAYRCDHLPARYAGKQVGSGDIVFAVQRGLARFNSALAAQTQLTVPKGDYAGELAEAAAGDWLLPWRANAGSDFQLIWWKPGQTTVRTAVQEAGLNVVQPVLVAERSVPKRHPSGLHDWSFGNLLCLNSYTSKYKFAAASIASVRLFTKTSNGREVLGTAPVESDGSFFVQVAGDQPLQIELLDSKGKILKRETGWFWLRRGEQRACVGCHAGPETAPENAVPLILLKSTTPADMSHPARHSSAGGN
jgi:hypothetical protein